MKIYVTISLVSIYFFLVFNQVFIIYNDTLILPVSQHRNTTTGDSTNYVMHTIVKTHL